MLATLNEYLINSAQRTEAAQWVTSDHVTAMCDKWRKERFERRECACGEIIPQSDADYCVSFDEYICRSCR